VRPVRLAVEACSPCGGQPTFG